MTDGTSQGLFIVVAIVIFGIFVSLSYTVFGSMGDGLHNLVEDATEESMRNLIGGEVIYSNDFQATSIRTNELYTPTTYSISEDVFEQGGRYTIEFDLEVTQGTLKAIRGHLHISSSVQFYIDNVLQPQSENIWRTFSEGVLFDNPYTEGDIVSFRITFTADRYDDPISHFNNSFNISPNHYYVGGDRYELKGQDAVNYHNIKIIKHN